MDAGPVSMLEGLRRSLNILFAGARKRSNARTAYLPADIVDSGKISRGSNRKAGFHDIDSKSLETVGHA
jgi:hypothetical protein